MVGYGKRVLLVGEMETVRQPLAEVLDEEGLIVVQARDGVQALWEMQHRHFDAVVTDDRMPRLNGLDLVRQCRMAWPETPIILFGDLEWDKIELAKARGAFAWIRKSADPGILLSMLALAFEHIVERRSVQAIDQVGA